MPNFLRLGFKPMSIGQFLSFIFPMMLAVDPNCNYYQNMNIGVTYYVYNKEYPDFYSSNQNCLWIATVPDGYNVEISCKLELPQTSGCIDDRVLISLTGQQNLENAEVLCGNGTVQRVSTYNNISIGLQSSYMSNGGRFSCTLEAKPVEVQTCDCGWRNMRRIVGGVETKVNEFPMMAGVIDLQIRDIICGATIIANRFAVSAAHCFTDKSADIIGLLLGDHDISTGMDTNSSRILFTQQLIIHPEYDKNDKEALNDIAIIKTQTEIEYSQAIGPACLPFRYYQYSFASANVYALGWGTTEFTGPKSDVLLKTDLNVLDYNECYDKTNGTINQMCTFLSGHDACQSDSGGPLLWTSSETHRLHLLGVISQGRGCATKTPGINTRVTSYLMWILSSTPDADYCVKS